MMSRRSKRIKDKVDTGEAPNYAVEGVEEGVEPNPEELIEEPLLLHNRDSKCPINFSDL